MKIKVLKKHITNGIRGQAPKCPVALAIQDKTKQDDWLVALNCAFRTSTGHFGKRNDHCASLPPEARSFIRAFDHGQDVDPFTFDLEIKKNA